MANNANLRKADSVKNDEFYTKLEDIEREIISHQDYARQFKDKVVLCNCDDPEISDFYKFFTMYFNQLGIKRLIVTHRTIDRSQSYKLELLRDPHDGSVNTTRTMLYGDGDFRSDECIELMRQSDIVVTNPPFSTARDLFIPLLFNMDKRFIIVGDLNWVTYKTVFPLLMNNKMWFGYTKIKEFRAPDGTYKKFGNKLWFTNMQIDKLHQELLLTKTYNGNEGSYPKFDYYDAINVSKVKDIPNDYYKLMGVPITFMTVYNPQQFEIVDGIGRYSIVNNEETKNAGHYLSMVEGVASYFRVIVRRKNVVLGL